MINFELWKETNLSRLGSKERMKKPSQSSVKRCAISTALELSIASCPLCCFAAGTTALLQLSIVTTLFRMVYKSMSRPTKCGHKFNHLIFLNYDTQNFLSHERHRQPCSLFRCTLRFGFVLGSRSRWFLLLLPLFSLRFPMKM